MSPTLRRSIRMLLGALAIGLVAAPAARAVQTSGSIILIPSDHDGIRANQEVTVDVYFQNNSTRTPDPTNPEPPLPPPVPAVPAFPDAGNLELGVNPATVNGPITIELCGDGCQCIVGVPDSNTDGLKDLVFVPGAVSGCAQKDAAVSSCIADPLDPNNKVLINLVAPLLVSTATPKYLATIRFRNTVPNPDPLPRVHLQAMIGMCALNSCVAPNSDCAECSAEGCSFVQGEAVPDDLLSCKHGCLNRIDFFPQQPQDPDKAHINVVARKVNYDPAAESFRLKVVKNGAVFFDTGLVAGVPVSGTIWSTVVPPGGTPGNAGVSTIEIHKLDGTGKGGLNCTADWYFKFIVEGWGNFEAARMPDPPLEIQLELGGQTFKSGVRQWNSIGPPGNVRAITFNFPNSEWSPC